MKTFQEIFSTDFSKQLINRKAASPKFVNTLIDCYSLNQLRCFLPASLTHHLIVIMRSKIHAKQIAFGFNSQAACIEFNKYHAKNILQTLQSNPTIREKLQLQDCECLQGFVNRNYTKLYDIVEIKSNALQEESFGNFTNHATYPELKQKFEVIRNIILSHRKQLQNLAQQQIDSKPQAYNLSDKTFYKKPTKQ